MVEDKNKVIKLEKEIAYDLDKEGKKIEVKDPSGRVAYVRNDLDGLHSLFQRFDSRRYDMDEWKMYIKVKNKLTACYLEKKDELELNQNQFKFLKSFLGRLIEENNKSSKEKEEKKILFQDFQIRTLLGVYEQMTEAA